MYYEYFEKLCNDRGVTPYVVSKATGISRATLSEWKNGKYTPKQDKLIIIANYFGVPSGCLIGELPIPLMSDMEVWVNEQRQTGATDNELMLRGEGFVQVSSPEELSEMSGGKYYYNSETAAIAQEIFENKELRGLFDAARDVDPTVLKSVHNILLNIKRQGNNED